MCSYGKVFPIPQEYEVLVTKLILDTRAYSFRLYISSREKLSSHSCPCAEGLEQALCQEFLILIRDFDSTHFTAGKLLLFFSIRLKGNPNLVPERFLHLYR